MEPSFQKSTEFAPSGPPAGSIAARPAAALLVALVALAAPARAFDVRPQPPAEPTAQDKDLAPQWNKWLNEEVVYIISDRERDLFLKLVSDEQREEFARQFWVVRDPTPGTDQNEYRDEHYKRLDYADKFYGRGSVMEGWRTDRGRMYIVLGKPREVNTFSSGGTVYPSELWFYQADPKKRLPPFFYLIFFKRHGSGEMVLYNPVADGTQALLTPTTSSSGDYARLRDFNPELAQAAYSYLPDEAAGFSNRPSLSSLTLLAQIENVKNIDTDASYAERILLGQTEVTAEYTFSNVKLANVIAPYVDDAGDAFIDYAFEYAPDQVDLGQYEDKIYGGFEVVARLADREGETLVSRTEKIEISWTEQEFESAKTRPLHFEDRLVGLPGDYNLTIQVRNRVTREFHLITRDVVIPESPPAAAGAGELVLARDIQNSREAGNPATLPFHTTPARFLPAPRGVFSTRDIIFVYCQLYLPQQQRLEIAQIGARISVVNADAVEVVAVESQLPTANFTAAGTFHYVARIPAGQLQPGEHTVALRLEFGPAEVATRRAGFRIVTAESPLPQVHVGSETRNPAQMKLELGRLWAKKGDKERALGIFLEALNANPRNNDLRIAAADMLSETGKFEMALRTLENWAVEEPDNPRLLRRISSYYMEMKEYGKASKYLERLVRREAETVEAWNLLGKACFLDGKAERAAEAWRRSLELEPNQPEIAEQLRTMESRSKDGP